MESNDVINEFSRALSGPPQAPTLTFERRYDLPPEELWDALTNPERVARWFGRITSEPPSAIGDEFTVDLGGGPEDLGRGRIVECSPGHVLGYEWQWQDEPISRVRATLQPIEDATVLRLEHAQVPRDHVIGYGGGWEWCLLALDDETSGTSRYAATLEAHESVAQALWRNLQSQVGP